LFANVKLAIQNSFYVRYFWGSPKSAPGGPFL
jgi:hypothetical protein